MDGKKEYLVGNCSEKGNMDTRPSQPKLRPLSAPPQRPPRELHLSFRVVNEIHLLKPSPPMPLSGFRATQSRCKAKLVQNGLAYMIVAVPLCRTLSIGALTGLDPIVKELHFPRFQARSMRVPGEALFPKAPDQSTLRAA